jgi:hypothetical protein
MTLSTPPAGLLPRLLLHCCWRPLTAATGSRGDRHSRASAAIPSLEIAVGTRMRWCTGLNPSARQAM